MWLFIRSLLAIGLAIGLLAASGIAAEPSPSPDPAPKAACDCQRMQAAGLGAGAMMACPLMQRCAKAGMPNALLSMKFKLGLTEDQVAKLEALVKKVQEESLALLTDEQKKTLDAMSRVAEPDAAPAKPPAQPQSQTQPQTQPQAQSTPPWRGFCGMVQGGGCCRMMQSGGCPMGR